MAKTADGDVADPLRAIAHELNNLHTAILGYATLLQRSLPAGDARRADLDEILKAGKRASELSHKLLASRST